MNFHVSRRYSDLPSDIITGGCREKDVREAQEREEGWPPRFQQGREKRAGRTIREGGWEEGERDLFY